MSSPEIPRTAADIECELRCLRYQIRRATEELDRAGVEKYDNRPRADSTDDSEGTEWSIQKRIKLLAESPVDAERERLLDLLENLGDFLDTVTQWTGSDPDELHEHRETTDAVLREYGRLGKDES